MKSYLILIKYCLSIFLIFTQLSIASPQQSLNELKNKIVGNTFPQEMLENYEFYLLNNKIEFDQELNFLSGLKSSFETEYLQSVILFKENDFSNAFVKLLSLLNTNPTYYPYYELLTKAARITNNESNVENNFNKITSEKFKNYLKAQLSYQKAEYLSAKELFNIVLKSDSTSFETLYMIAYTQRNLGKYDSALEYFNKAVKIVERNEKLLAKVTIAIGSLFYLSGNYEKAKELYKRGLKTASESGNNTEKIKALLNFGMILDEEGNIDKARVNFEEASKLAAEIGDNELEATCLSEYAVSYTYTDERIKAREKYEQSFLLFQKLKNKRRVAVTAVNIGNSFLNVANYKSSIKYYELGLKEAGENVRTKMLALRGLGDVYTNLSDFAKALDYYTKAKILAKQINDVPANAKINIGLGILYFNLEMPQKALELLKESERSLSETENPYLKLEIEQKIGIIYSSIDSLSLAYSYLKNSTNLAKIFGDIYSEILSNTFLVDILIKQGDINFASPLLNETIKSTIENDYKQLLGLQNLLLSEISKAKLDKTNQIKYISRAKTYAAESNDFSTLITANQKLGEIYEQNHELEKAEKYYQTAIDLIENNYNSLFTKSDIQIKFFSNYYSVYNSLINLYLSESKFSSAFELLEKSKAKNTNQNLVILKLESAFNNDKLLNEYFDFTWKLNSGLYNEDELNLIAERLKIIKDSISLVNPNYGAYLNNNSHFSFNEIQKKLKANQYFISFFVQNNYLFAFQISSLGLKTKRINVSLNKLNELKSAISPYYNNNIANNEISFNKDLFAFNAESAQEFYKNIVQPIVSEIPTDSKIIFSLPSEMMNIPFEFLVTKSNSDSSPYLLDDKRFLINDFNISYTPSALIWNKLKNDNRSNSKIALLIGDPFFDSDNQEAAGMRGLTSEMDFNSRNINNLRLEYSADEIETISSLLGDEKIYLAKDATETAFKNNVERASIVHLSTHSFLYKNNPLILFSNDDKENDGFLEVGEILKLNLRSDMVVLSSCKSGLGRIDKAEGIIGMQKAFFDAGAKSMVVSHWDVDDKYTSIFMKYFYSFLSDGYSKSESLRLAKLKFIKLNKANPYYWSAFTIAGNDMPIGIEIKNYNFVILLTILFSILVLGFYFLYYQRYWGKKIVKAI